LGQGKEECKDLKQRRGYEQLQKLEINDNSMIQDPIFGTGEKAV
jgi:hypothetical protein